MKTEEQKSAFILRVDEMIKEIRTLMPEGGGERSCIILVNEEPEDSDITVQRVAIIGSGNGLTKNMAAFFERPDMAEIASIGAKLAIIKGIITND